MSIKKLNDLYQKRVVAFSPFYSDACSNSLENSMLKSILLLVFLALASISQAYPSHSALPENDLWMEDYFEKSNSGEEMFNRVIEAAEVVYKPIMEEFGDSSLTINRKWSDPMVNANATRFFGNVTINMFGGLFRRPETTVEGFTLVLCHELNHAYGGLPYIRAWQKLSAEGQADYAGAKECMHKVLAVLKLEYFEEEPTGFMEDTCASAFKTEERQKLCVRSLVGGQSLGTLLATIKEEAMPDYETPDPMVVEETLLSYPATIQCRLDTYLRGTLQLDRPACWFKD